MKNLRLEVIESLKKYCPRNVSRQITSMIDELYIVSYDITYEEYNYICNNATSAELEVWSNVFINDHITPYQILKQTLKIRNKYLENFHNGTNINTPN